jgi:hypothetical protein
VCAQLCVWLCGGQACNDQGVLLRLQAERFTGTLESVDKGYTRKRMELTSPSISTPVRRSDLLLSQAKSVLNNVMDGYEVPTDMVEQALSDRDLAFMDISLPLLQFDDVMATIGDKLPLPVSEALYQLLDPQAETPPSQRSMFLYPEEFNMATVDATLNAAESSIP